MTNSRTRWTTLRKRNKISINFTSKQTRSNLFTYVYIYSVTLFIDRVSLRSFIMYPLNFLTISDYKLYHLKHFYKVSRSSILYRDIITSFKRSKRQYIDNDIFHLFLCQRNSLCFLLKKISNIKSKEYDHHCESLLHYPNLIIVRLCNK